MLFSASAILRFLEISIPSIFAVILFILATRKESSVKEKDILQLRLDSFYVPFYQLYMRCLLNFQAIGDLSLENQGNLLDLLINNIHLLGTVSQGLVQKYYLVYLDLLEAENGNPMFSFDYTRDVLDKVFRELTATIQGDYVEICRKLKLPMPASMLV